MARTAVNPRVLSCPGPQGLELMRVLAVDAKTWKKGELVILSTGVPTPLVDTGSTAVWGIFAEDQTTATSTSTVPIYRLEAGTRLAMYVMTNGVAATAATAVRGTRYGAEGLSNVSYLDTGTANGQFEVIGPYSEQNDLSDKNSDCDAAPGLVVVEFKFIS